MRKSIFDKSRQVALLKIKYIYKEINDLPKRKIINLTKKTISPQIDEKKVAKELNNLARKKMQETLLKDLTCDLMVCKIEGYDINEYILELKNLIDDCVKKITKEV